MQHRQGPYQQLMGNLPLNRVDTEGTFLYVAIEMDDHYSSVQYMQKLLQQFWSKEYLCHLPMRSKWVKDPFNARRYVGKYELPFTN